MAQFSVFIHVHNSADVLKQRAVYVDLCVSCQFVRVCGSWMQSLSAPPLCNWLAVCLTLCMSSGDSKENRFAADRDEYGADTMTEINIIGRITLNLWRVMKTEAGVLT